MVQAADLWEGDNGTCRARMYGPRLRTVLGQREMRAALVMILKVCRHHTAQVTLIEDDDVIETSAAARADDALDIAVLPRRSRRGGAQDGHLMSQGDEFEFQRGVNRRAGMTPDRHGVIARKVLILLELSSSSGVNRTPIRGHTDADPQSRIRRWLA